MMIYNILHKHKDRTTFGQTFSLHIFAKSCQLASVLIVRALVVVRLENVTDIGKKIAQAMPKRVRRLKLYIQRTAQKAIKKLFEKQ